MEAATARYANFPRNRRAALHARIIGDPNSPFRDGPDDSPIGRWFAFAIGDVPAPVAELPLNEIIRQLPLTDVQKVELADIFIVHMNALQGQGGGRKRKTNRRRSHRRRSRKN